VSTAITILGCGSSGGVPRVGQGWGACDPKEPRNRRRRCSILIETAGPDGQTTTVLVDASPDLREQLLDTNVKRLDGLILTHDHADHTHGLDDLRPLTLLNRRRIDVYTHAETAQTMRNRFDYCFVATAGYPPILNLHTIPLQGSFSVTGAGGGIDFTTFAVTHGLMDVLALKFSNTVYTPDVSAISDENLDQIADLDLWIIDALRPAPHPTHFCLAEALAWIDRMRPRRAVLTNLHTDLDYKILSDSLPAHISVAYDGMRLEIG
jgi:phosphoribosyl 1,2-cyclic phosphate phosphodiesterase